MQPGEAKVAESRLFSENYLPADWWKGPGSITTMRQRRRPRDWNDAMVDAGFERQGECRA